MRPRRRPTSSWRVRAGESLSLCGKDGDGGYFLFPGHQHHGHGLADDVACERTTRMLSGAGRQPIDSSIFMATVRLRPDAWLATISAAGSGK